MSHCRFREAIELGRAGGLDPPAAPPGGGGGSAEPPSDPEDPGGGPADPGEEDSARRKTITWKVLIWVYYSIHGPPTPSNKKKMLAPDGPGTPKIGFLVCFS